MVINKDSAGFGYVLDIERDKLQVAFGMHIRSLHKSRGTQITGLDPAQEPGEQTFECLRSAFLEHHLLCVRISPLTVLLSVRLAIYSTCGLPSRISKTYL